MTRVEKKRMCRQFALCLQTILYTQLTIMLLSLPIFLNRTVFLSFFEFRILVALLLFVHSINLYFFSLLKIRPIGLFQFRIISEMMNHRQTVGLHGQVISSLQGLYLHRTTQYTQVRTNIHAVSGIQTCNPVYEHSRPVPQTAWPPDRHQSLFIWINSVQRIGGGGRVKQNWINLEEEITEPLFI
jgi:hypothetical protein